MAQISQLAFAGPVVAMAKLFGPIAGFNLSLICFLSLGGVANWWAAKELTGDRRFAMLAIPFGGFFEYLIWTVGGPSALVSYWPIPVSLGILLPRASPIGIKRVLMASLVLTVSLFSDPFIALSVLVIWGSSIFFYCAHKRWRDSTTLALGALSILALTSLFLLSAREVSRSGLGGIYGRNFVEWEKFGGQWWMVALPSPQIPIISGVFDSIRYNFLEQTVPAVRTSGQLLNPGLFAIGLVVVGGIHRLINRQMGAERDMMFQFLMVVFFVSIALQMVVRDTVPLARFAPSRLLFEVSTVWRYTGRLTILTHVVASLLIVNEFRRLWKVSLLRRVSARFVVLSLAALSILGEIVMPILRVEVRSFSFRDAPKAYSDLRREGDSPYVDLPSFSAGAMYPSAVFQVLSQQPTLDTVGNPLGETPYIDGMLAPQALALALDNLCAPQTSRGLAYFGLRYAVIHSYRLTDGEPAWGDCGWRIVRRYPRAEGAAVSPLLITGDVLLAEASNDTRLGAFLLPRSSEWTTNYVPTYNFSYTTTTASDSGSIDLLRAPGSPDIASRVSFSINSDAIVTLSCAAERKLSAVEIRRRLTAGLVTIEVPSECTSLRLTARQNNPLTISELLAS